MGANRCDIFLLFIIHAFSKLVCVLTFLHVGVIDIHLPERWGVLQFSDGPVNETEVWGEERERERNREKEKRESVVCMFARARRGRERES